MENPTPQDLILEIIKQKSILKQDVYANTEEVFAQFREVLKEVIEEINNELDPQDDRVVVRFAEKGKFEAQITIAGDVLIFHMHTNVFFFDANHSLWKTSYLKDDASRAYCGIINVYNFLADSFKYNRFNDSGYLIARVFINKESHFKVEGKRQLGFLYNDFVNAVLDRDKIKSVIQSAILYTIDFDLLTPPYDNVKEVTVHEMRELSGNLQLKTAKRLGFKFQSDSDEIE